MIFQDGHVLFGSDLNTAFGAINSVTIITPVTGFNTTIPAGTTFYLMTPAGTLATGTLTMPVTPVTGAPQTLRICSSQTITALTLLPNTGQTISVAPTTLAANTSALFVISGSIWYRV